jgi:DNA polymerase III subunit epsilon
VTRTDELSRRSGMDAYLSTPMPADSTSWRTAAICVIDLETTGLDPATNEIIAFATLPIAGGRVRPREARYRLVRPNRMPEAATIRIHGLRSEELADAPSLSDVLGDLVEPMTATALVVHVRSVEEGFLGRVIGDAGGVLRNPVIDTAELATELFSRRRQSIESPIGLTALARRLGLPVHRPHEADGDALTTAQVFLALATQLDRFEPQTIGSLRRLPHRLAPWRTLRRALRRVRS